MWSLCIPCVLYTHTGFCLFILKFTISYTSQNVLFSHWEESCPACRGAVLRRRRVAREEAPCVATLGGMLRWCGVGGHVFRGEWACLCLCLCLRPVAMFDLRTGVDHLLARLSAPFHCRRPVGSNRHHYNKVHPELAGCKPRRLLRIGFGHYFSSVRPGGSDFRYRKVSCVSASEELTATSDTRLGNMWYVCVLFAIHVGGNGLR
jgi:hypothetical protein